SASDQGDLWVSRSEILFAQGDEEKMRTALHQAEEIFQRSGDRLLEKRIQLLFLLLPCLQKKIADPSKILEKARALILQGDVEFVLDNLMRAFLLDDNWPEELKQTIRAMAEEVSQRLPADYQTFFNRYYGELMEKTSGPEKTLMPTPHPL